jgi:glutamate N-acetyltransferase/amino-acid N-acetyltransferase
MSQPFGSPQVRDWPEGRLRRIAGFRAGALHCGLKTISGRPDLAILVCDRPASAAGVFTTNRVCAAPVKLSRRLLARSRGHARGVVVNSGNANACTGARGARDAREMGRLAERGLGLAAGQMLVCSTGVIGHLLPMEKVADGLARLTRRLSRVGEGLPAGGQGDDGFERAILTTDLVPKFAGARVRIGGRRVSVAGTCKGSGMIAPRLATMLAFLATDAAVAPAALQAALEDAARETFNCLTVDGDTSTNDSLLLLASGAAGHPQLTKARGADYEALRAAVFQVCDSLARQVAKDGEGARHLVTVYVGGTAEDGQARRIARTIAESPLVKTALAGCDPNWGRILAAAGRAGVSFRPEDCTLTVCGHELFRGGRPTDFDRRKVAKALRAREVSLVLLVGEGGGRARFYTCDLTHGYITINAEYHT